MWIKTWKYPPKIKGEIQLRTRTSKHKKMTPIRQHQGITKPTPVPSKPQLLHPTRFCPQTIPSGIQDQAIWNHTGRLKGMSTANKRIWIGGENWGQSKTHKHFPQLHTSQVQANKTRTTKNLLEKNTTSPVHHTRNTHCQPPCIPFRTAPNLQLNHPYLPPIGEWNSSIPELPRVRE